jgi:hypothetical protein
VGRTGPEIYLTIKAITGSYRLFQSFLGTRGHVDGGSSDLVLAMRQTVGTLFWSLESDFGVWSVTNGSQPVPTHGTESEITLEPLHTNRKRMREMFLAGVAELEPVFKSILSPSTLTELQGIAALGEEGFRYPAELWAKTVYEFAASYHKSVINRDHIIQALAPLYRGRIFTFLGENQSTDARGMEASLESLCGDFERLKPRLLEMWNGGK